MESCLMPGCRLAPKLLTKVHLPADGFVLYYGPKRSSGTSGEADKPCGGGVLRYGAVACPYFLPFEPAAVDPPPARAPLGRFYSGDCTARAVADQAPSELLDRCNFGYSRGCCDRFPAESAADCVRFSVNPGGELIYVLERNHSPVVFGLVREASSQVQRQAAAFERARTWR
jgi:hypothetical protein